jgi:Kelch motif/Galactose oxidase, central domain
MSRWPRWSARAAYAVALAALISLAGPGPRRGNAASSAIVPAGNAVTTHQVVLSGTAVQGPMAASTVTAYAVDPATGADLQVLGTAKTDASGNFSVKILSRASPLRLAVAGGSFISEADGGTVAQPRRVTVLLPGATSDISGISINPLTRFVNALTIGRLQTGHTTFAAALTNATATIESYYSLSTDPRRLLPDYTVSGIGTDAGKLGLILGALINEDLHLCPGNPGELVTALALYIVSGVFNGRYAGLPVPYCGGALPAIAGTSDFQDALAGVQQLQYVSSGFAFGGLYGPAGNILINQTPPVTPDLLLASLTAINAAITKAAPSTASTSSPPMAAARGFATATLLPNGKVLIAGGFGTTTTDASELYDPATNKFSAGPPMSQARGEATATLLPNGKVLIAGGNDGTNALSTTEIYDIATKTFAPGPSMIAARFAAGATLLANGKVLIAGGNASSPFGELSSTELYDPSTNSFAAGPSMSVAMGPSTAILMPNGKVLIVGDGVHINPYVSVAELYDPSDNSMAERSLNTACEFPAAALLPNGKVLIAGGAGQLLTPINTTQIYDPSQDAFSDGPPMNNAHWVPTAAPTANGKMLIVGGNGLDVNALNSVEVYDSVTNSFTGGTPMNDPRLFPTATLLPNGRVLIAGGVNGTNETNALESTELYTP